MGADIHMYAEFRNSAGQWEEIPGYEPFSDRNRHVFSFFSEGFVRSDYDWGSWHVTPYPIIEEARGLPGDVSLSIKAKSDEWGTGGSGHSWLSVDELVSYDYNKPLRERSVDVPEEFVQLTVRESLGENYFLELAELQKQKAERLVFWFDF
ncbi:hypothetical protein ACTL6P_16045 [Endozoicomonas acroporae]|uniref:hypothetical protein n=1 Tax=Endozoicomonas acroporae TaxID=1701104 RepID=UPI0011AF4D59|nr:hypothetical protein [Endozoicomonas acroporae]